MWKQNDEIEWKVEPDENMWELLIQPFLIEYFC